MPNFHCLNFKCNSSCDLELGLRPIVCSLAQKTSLPLIAVYSGQKERDRRRERDPTLLKKTRLALSGSETSFSNFSFTPLAKTGFLLSFSSVPLIRPSAYLEVNSAAWKKEKVFLCAWRVTLALFKRQTGKSCHHYWHEGILKQWPFLPLY